jgi:hypothetical protein
MKRMYLLFALALSGLSGQASATLVTYGFSGALNCSADPYCGVYTGTVTIDDAQTGTEVGPEEYQYALQDARITYADGTQLTDSTVYFIARNAPTIQEVGLFVSTPNPLVDYHQFFWQFALASFDISEITEVLDALTTGTLISGQSTFKAIGDDEVRGSVTLLTEKSTVPLPATLALIGLGLVLIRSRHKQTEAG